MVRFFMLAIYLVNSILKFAPMEEFRVFDILDPRKMTFPTPTLYHLIMTLCLHLDFTLNTDVSGLT